MERAAGEGLPTGREGVKRVQFDIQIYDIVGFRAVLCKNSTSVAVRYVFQSQELQLRSMESSVRGVRPSLQLKNMMNHPNSSLN